MDQAPAASACVDICALGDKTKYLIFQDKRFVELSSLKDELPATENRHAWGTLNDQCQGGLHYIAGIWTKSGTKDDGISERISERLNDIDVEISTSSKFVYSINEEIKFYIIKDNFRITIVSDLKNASGISEVSLYKDYQLGDFYFSNGSSFYIIFKERNEFLQTSDITKAPDVDLVPQKLHEKLRNGLYYFATNNFIYVVTYANNGTNGHLVYHRTALLTDPGEEVPVHRSVTDVLLRQRVQSFQVQRKLLL